MCHFYTVNTQVVTYVESFLHLIYIYLPSLIFLCFRGTFHELHLVRRREKCCGTHPNKGSQKTLPLCFRLRFFTFAFDKTLQLQCEK